MSVMGLRDIEKIEMFYLKSCTDLPLAQSLHQSFPALNDTVYTRQPRTTSSRISRSLSRRSSNSGGSGTTLKSNNRAKLAFFKICESLASGLGHAKTDSSVSLQRDTGDMPSNGTIVTTGSCHLIMIPSMSKDEFIKKLEEGIVQNSTTVEKSTFAENFNETEEEQINHLQIDKQEHKHAKSDSVLIKSITTAETDKETISTQNTSKSTTAIADDRQQANELTNDNGMQYASTASKAIFTGILLLVFLGIIKNASSS